ncbi:MAG: 30S ribosomal protein S20 [Patescibacteria group bacterium]
MAITSSAKKALRSSENKRVVNLRRKNAIASVVKQVKKLVSEKKMKEAEALLPSAFQAIDKAAAIHFIHKNAAARRKSRLAALFAKK